jgi:peptidoglycan/LPS O-acetylase OafA/YrhL
MLAAHHGAWVDDIPQRLAMNASFAFGAWDPAVTALLIGGWSLGIEFVYYLAFPFIVRVLRHAWLRTVLFAVCVAVQWLWIERTVGTAGWADSVVSYHQAPAFSAYFFGGCILGHMRRERGLAWPLAAGLAAWGGMAGLLYALMPANAGDELVGVRGAALFAACFAVVFVSGQVVVTGRVRALAAWLGDVTYGCYLLHPIVLWSLLWFAWPGAVDAPLPLRVGVLLAVLAATCALATASEKRFERPIRRWARRKAGPKGPPAHIDAASISS